MESSANAVDLPLAVDLDGTLVNTDLLVESMFCSLSHNPLGFIRALIGLGAGVATAKKNLALLSADLAPENLPFNADLVEYLRSEKARGREIALVSASNHQLVSQVANHLELFDWHQGSTPDNNLKGELKARFLTERYPDGFVYAGDSAADVAVWRKAKGAIAVSVSSRVDGALRELTSRSPLEKRFDFTPPTLATWAKALRLHQWIKNALILIPLFLSGLFMDAGYVAQVSLGVLAFGLIASGGYLFNDLLDLQADRVHPSKRHRPLAAGLIGPFSAMAVCAGSIASGLLVMSVLSIQAGLLALAYLAGTLTYSVWIKRLALVDLVALGGLFTVRVAIGTSLINASYSTWLLTFSMFFFFSLSAVKRVAELMRVGSGARRGYLPADLGLLQNLGVSMSTAALVIFVLYLENEALVQGNYPNPQWLWLAPLAVFVWLCRLWLMAVRGVLHDDPVVFALKDPVSMTIGAVLGFSVLAAHLL
ncbi:MAG: UbiA family prenyltransferase [Lysobacterales bacterium]